MKRIWILLLWSVFCLAGAAETTFYVAPEQRGSGEGASADSAAAVDRVNWTRVAAALADGPVRVEFAAGVYTPEKGRELVRLSGLGHEKHLLTLAGAPKQQSVIRRAEGDESAQNLITVRACRNLRIEKFLFTGANRIGYALPIGDSCDVTVAGCHFIDMTGIVFGCTGAHGAKTVGVTYEDCRFDNIGCGGGSHMIYNANNSRRITLRNCFFRDCFGDYVRFRNGCDEILVENCTFIDNGRYLASPFLAMPLFTDFDNEKHWEYFAGKIVIRNNVFTYRRPAKRSCVLMYHHSGYNPPGKNYLMSKEDAAALKAMSVAAGRRALSERLGTDVAGVVIAGNRVSGCRDRVRYESRAAFGAEAKYPKELYNNDLVLDRFFEMR